LLLFFFEILLLENKLSGVAGLKCDASLDPTLAFYSFSNEMRHLEGLGSRPTGVRVPKGLEQKVTCFRVTDVLSLVKIPTLAVFDFDDVDGTFSVNGRHHRPP
jgi:hypothetical protein